MNEIERHDRREFMKKSLSMGAAVGGALLFGRPEKLLAGNAASGAPDLVAVKNGEPDVMFDKAIALMGGMKKFVEKGQTVVVKPNIAWNKTPEFGANTNPLLVKSIIEHCFGAGAKKVYVLDHIGFLSAGMERKCYRNSGIEDAAKSAGALVAPADNEKYYQKVDIPEAKVLKTVAVHEKILEADVFINVPILKDHSFARLTIAMKNLMGAIWDQMSYHSIGLDECIADFCLFKKPDLNIVDAYRVMTQNGPQGMSLEDVTMKKTLLISKDIVAVDSAAAKIFGMAPETVNYIKMGHELGVGNINLHELKIEKHVMS